MKTIKMFGKKSISALSYYILCSILAILALYFAYLSLSLLFGNYTAVELAGITSYNIPIAFDGIASQISIRMDSLGLFSWLFYFAKSGVFIYLLIVVFRNFKKSDFLFTRATIKSLKFFAILNIFMPLIYALFHVIMFQNLVFENVKGAFGNLYLGLLTLFILAIFKQGYKIQQENDLTI